MSTREKRILVIRGRDRYEEGLRHLHVVSNGAREEALQSFRQRAERLIAFEQTLNDGCRNKICSMLAAGTARSTEEAVLLLEKKVVDI